MKKKTETFYFRLSPGQKLKLKVLTDYYGCPTAQLIRLMIDSFYDIHEKLIKKCIDIDEKRE